MASEASYVKIFSEQKFIKNAKNSQFLKNWNLRSNSVTRQACSNITFGGKCHNFLFFKWKNL